MIPANQDLGRCPCIQEFGDRGCTMLGTKLAKVSGHLVGCSCPRCRGRNNKKRGQRGEARRHRRLGGVGYTPNDELMHSYSINVTTQDKVGAQIPASLWKFLDLEWTRKAFKQAEDKVPVASDAFPTLYIERSPSEWYLVVKGKGSLR